jgi:hypothetical protein
MRRTDGQLFPLAKGVSSSAWATTSIYFSSGKYSKCSRIATKYNLCKIINIIDVRTEFEMLKVKVSSICLSTAGVSLRREGR